MANYYATARSNHFRVKDREAFEAALEPFDLSLHWDREDASKVCLLWNTGDQGGINHGHWSQDEDDFIEVDLFSLISEHLVENEVAVFQEAGAEKFRYVTGYAVAVNHLGETVTITIDEIYALAANKFGIERQSISAVAY